MLRNANNFAGYTACEVNDHSMSAVLPCKRVADTAKGTAVAPEVVGYGKEIRFLSRIRLVV